MNIGADTMKAFSDAGSFQDRIVAFVDVMGVKNKMQHANTPSDLTMYATILNSHAHQPFAEGKLHISMFSDCMYIVTEVQYLDKLICLLSNFAYTMLHNRLVTIIPDGKGSFNDIIDWDCFKLRGGITYGKVFVLDEAAKNKGILLNTNMVLGSAPIRAYELESTKAIYPRIIVDDLFVAMLNELGKEADECHFTRDSEDGYYYLDFLDYMCMGNREKTRIFDLLGGCIDYIKAELDQALIKNNAKLVGQLLWYIRYLEKYVH